MEKAVVHQVFDLTEEIVKTEYTLFGKIKNEGGRASCQDNWTTFHAMRSAQFQAWNIDTLSSYKQDLIEAINEGRNPLFEKYAYMMEYTSPREYESIRPYLPTCSMEKEVLVEKIVAILLKQTKQFMDVFPGIAKRSRPVNANGDYPFFTSVETYMRGEYKTYSSETLKKLLEWIQRMEEEKKSIIFQIYENTAFSYGYDNLQKMEECLR